METKFSAHYSSINRGVYDIKKGISISEIEEIVNDPYLEVIRVLEPLAKRDYENLEKHIFSKNNNVLLSKYDYVPDTTSLGFLQYVPSIKRLSISNAINVTDSDKLLLLNNLEELSIVDCEAELFEILRIIKPELKALSVGKSLTKKLNIDFISRFSKLEYLFLEEHSKNIEEIGKLENLKEIVLRSVSVPNINFLKDLNKLWSIDIKLGGIKDFSILEQLPQVKYLELWQIKGLSDLSFISKMTGLQNLLLQSLTNVNALPSFINLPKLRRLSLMNLKGLEDFNALKTAPNLQDFFYTQIYQQQPEDLIPVLQNPKLKNAYVYFESNKKNTAFKELADSFGKQFSDWQDFIYDKE